jgi:hypothetical protein
MFSYEENEKIVNNAIHKCINESMNNKKFEKFMSVLMAAQNEKKCITVIHNCEYAYSGNNFIIDNHKDGYIIYVGKGNFTVHSNDNIKVESHCGKKIYFINGKQNLYNIAVII